MDELSHELVALRHALLDCDVPGRYSHAIVDSYREIRARNQRLSTQPSAGPALTAAQVYVGPRGWEICAMTHGQGEWLASLPHGIHDLVLRALTPAPKGGADE